MLLAPVPLDDFRYQEAIKIRNRRTGEVRTPSQPLYHWGGEWLVPLHMLQGISVQLLEARLDADDEAYVRTSLATWRTYWEQEQVPPQEIERRLAEMEESAREWEPGDESSDGTNSRQVAR